MAFNLFGPPTKNDIRVAYIDPNLGLVEGVTICQANEYAIKNPGTTFIFKNGNNVIQYLNINEVNDLEPDALTSTDKCGGINQAKKCGPPIIQFFGGGGIGASGNPVIGRDGSILAVDIVRGGNGYQYPPLVSARDNCNYGSGATLTAVVGEVVETVETYENEADFEDYELCEQTDVGYGTLYGPNGEDLGEWNPETYTNPGEDPIRTQVKEYEEIVRKLAKSPFWTTRKNEPTSITCSDPTVIPRKYDVTDKTNLDYKRSIGEKNPVSWNDFMNTYAISPVSPSNVRGSDYAGRIFTFEWNEEFPTDGEYIFRGLCDNKGELYINDEKISVLGGFNDPVIPIQKTFKKGIYNIRVDLLNIPLVTATTTSQQQKSKLKAKFIKKGTNFYLDVTGEGSAEISFVMDVNDNPNNAGLAAREVIIPSDSGRVRFTRKSSGVSVVFSEGSRQVQTGQDRVVSGSGYKENEVIKEKGKFTAGKTYGPIQIIGAGTGAKGPIINSPNRLGIRDADGDDENIKIIIEKISGGSSTIEVGEVISPRSWNENPMGVAITIDAPEPPIPQEPLPEQEGECPPNPIWTTRFPGAKETWYPVKFNGSKSPQGKQDPWAKFFNRYAISPIPPLDTPGTDGSGVLFKNSWDIEIPYDGFYKFAAQRDNTARIYVDGNLAFDVTTSGDDLWKDFRNKPKFQKVFIPKGRHTIGIELENTKSEFFEQITQKIFRTKDWQVSSPESTQEVDVDFNIRSVASSSYLSSFKIKELDIDIRKPSKTEINKNISKKVKVGTVYTVEIEIPQSEKITLKVRGKTLEVEDLKASTARDLFCTISKGKFFDVQNGAKKATCKFIVDQKDFNGTDTSEGFVGGTTKDGVVYEGPKLFHHQDNRWNDFMNNHSVSPVIPGSSSGSRKKFTWKGVKFPESGQYDITFLADSDAKLIINGNQILTSQGFAENPQTFKVNITQGVYDIVIDSEYPYTTSRTNTKEYFRKTNPTGFALVINKNVSVRRDYGKSWDENPIGIGAILIPPPCPKRIRGKGVVTNVIVNDPGNGYLSPVPQDQGYPVSLVLDDVIVENPGINYNCGVDQLTITPSNGAELDYVCDSFGKIKEVKVLNPGLGFTEYPQIRLITETGVNASFRPVFKVIRDPIVLPEKLIQVTDLVGLKQTGYIDGRAYYGAVYYDQGIRYAGFYETAGKPVRVYDTLQESIDATVTTRASAIQRQGTDVTSNDPTLNIPGTPRDLI